MGLFWLILLVVMLIIEAITLGLATIWFAGGAFVAFLTNLMGVDIPIQITVFFVVSLVLLFFTRPLAAKYMSRGREKTNLDSMIGNTGIVIEEINNLLEKGTVKVNGLEWMARSIDEKIIKNEKQVIIESISGVKLIVREKKEENFIGCENNRMEEKWKN